MQQLSALDTLFLSRETERTPLHISRLLIYDPSSTPGGRVRLRDILQLFESRLHMAPVLRRRLAEVPLGLDYPYWVETADFDLEFHVRHIALPKPGDWRQLCIQVARLHARILDRSRPLWEAYVIEGLDNIAGLPRGSFALLLKLHHAAIDPAPASDIVGVIHDTSPDPSEATGAQPPRWRPETIPATSGLLARAWLNTLRQPSRLAHTLVSNAPGISGLRDALQRHRLLAGRERPLTRFNGTVSAHRSFDARFYPLAAIHNIRNLAPGATINDVVVTLIAGALRRYLLTTGELPPASLIAGAPINIRTSEDADGTRVQMMTLTLYTDIADPVERLHQVHEECLASKEYAHTAGARALTDLTQAVSPRRGSLGLRAASQTMLMSEGAAPINTVISNIPGARVPLYLCGARLLCSAGLGAVLDDMGLVHLVPSYHNGISIGFTACRDMLPDPTVYGGCIHDSFEELNAAARTLGRRRSSSRHSRRPRHD